MIGGAEQAAHDLGQTVQPVRCDATCAGKRNWAHGHVKDSAERGICLFVRFFTTRRVPVRREVCTGRASPSHSLTGQASLLVFYALNFIKKDIFLYRLDSEQPVLFSFFYDLQNFL